MFAKLPQIVCLVLATAIILATGPLAALSHGTPATATPQALAAHIAY